MGGAANAISDVFAAPPTRGPAPATPADEEAGAFDQMVEHEAAAHPNEEEAPRAPSKPRRPGEPEQVDDAHAAEGACATTPPPAQEQPSGAFVLQMDTPQAPPVTQPAAQAPQAAEQAVAQPVAATPQQAAQPQTPQAADAAPAPVVTPTQQAPAPQAEAAAQTAAPQAEAIAQAQAPAQQRQARTPNLEKGDETTAPKVDLQATPTPTTAQPIQRPQAPASTTNAPAEPALAALNAEAQPKQAKAEAAPIAGKRIDATTQAPRIDAPTSPNGAQPQATAKAATPKAAEAAVEKAAAPPSQAPALAAPAMAHPAAAAQAASSSHVTSDTRASQASSAANQVGREIVRRFNGDGTRFEMRLDPPELGRVEVKLDVSRDNRVTAVIAADSPQALSELSRHARELEQALQSAGLDLSEDGLSFDLSGQQEAFTQNESRGQSRGGGEQQAAAPDAPAPVARPIGMQTWRGVRIDVMA